MVVLIDDICKEKIGLLNDFDQYLSISSPCGWSHSEQLFLHTRDTHTHTQTHTVTQIHTHEHTHTHTRSLSQYNSECSIYVTICVHETAE